jgi:hypothetical protein
VLSFDGQAVSIAPCSAAVATWSCDLVWSIADVCIELLNPEGCHTMCNVARVATTAPTPRAKLLQQTKVVAPV